METTVLFEMGNDGLNMECDGDYLYIRCKRDVYKFGMADMGQTAHCAVFKKDGKSRALSVRGEYVFLHDFCDLYILDKADLRTLDILRLGEDLSSDLCGRARLDSQKAYYPVRNGVFAVVDMDTKEATKHKITDSSFWDFCIAGDRIYAGTVKGELIELDKYKMEIIRRIEVCKKKNIYSLLAYNDLLYLVSQDRTIKAVDPVSFETVSTAKKAVGNMARLLGVYDGRLVAADNGKISIWDTPSLRPCETFAFPTGAWSSGVALAGNRLFGSDFANVYSRVL